MKKQNFVVDLLFVLALFTMFAISAVSIVVVGINSYRHTVDDMEINSEVRTSVSYITEKLRQNDLADNTLTISKLAGQECLVFTSDNDGALYQTYLYFYDGYLRELLVKEGSDIGSSPLNAGTKVIALSAFKLSKVDDNLIQIDLTTESGVSRELFYSSKCN